MDDLISRQKAKDMLWNERQRLNTFMDECAESNQPELRYFTKIERNQVEADIDILDRVPSAQPERKKGRWKPLYDNIWICTNCEQTEQFGVNIESISDYCPNCGARMEGESDE